MDLNTVTEFRRARTRADLALAPGEVFLAGGTALMGEPQPAVTGFVDLTTMGWPDLDVTPAGLRISSTCTIARLVGWSQGRTRDLPPVPRAWRATSLIPAAANALLASFKIWNTATVGGNICRSYAAGAMISLAATLDGVAEVWLAGGGECRLPVADLITGDGTNALGHGDLLRAIELPVDALHARTVLRKVALTELGRSGAVVTGRLDESGASLFTLTASTLTPVILRFDRLPSPDTLGTAVASAEGYYTDALGAADWRRGVSVVLAEQARAQLEAAE